MLNVRLFCVGVPIEKMCVLDSGEPPSVQATVPVVAGMTSCWACAGHAMAASNRRVASLARGGGGTPHLFARADFAFSGWVLCLGPVHEGSNRVWVSSLAQATASRLSATAGN